MKQDIDVANEDVDIRSDLKIQSWFLSDQIQRSNPKEDYQIQIFDPNATGLDPVSGKHII